jgi:hypothetical protein
VPGKLIAAPDDGCPNWKAAAAGAVNCVGAGKLPAPPKEPPNDPAGALKAGAAPVDTAPKPAKLVGAGLEEAPDAPNAKIGAIDDADVVDGDEAAPKPPGGSSEESELPPRADTAGAAAAAATAPKGGGAGPDSVKGDGAAADKAGLALAELPKPKVGAGAEAAAGTEASFAVVPPKSPERLEGAG